MGAMASQITSLTIVYSTLYSDPDQRKHQSSASLAFVREIHRGPVNSPHKWPVTRKMFPFHDVIMDCQLFVQDLAQELKKMLKYKSPPCRKLFHRWIKYNSEKMLFKFNKNKPIKTYEYKCNVINFEMMKNNNNWIPKYYIYVCQ